MRRVAREDEIKVELSVSDRGRDAMQELIYFLFFKDCTHVNLVLV